MALGDADFGVAVFGALAFGAAVLGAAAFGARAFGAATLVAPAFGAAAFRAPALRAPALRLGFEAWVFGVAALEPDFEAVGFAVGDFAIRPLSSVLGSASPTGCEVARSFAVPPMALPLGRRPLPLWRLRLLFPLSALPREGVIELFAARLLTTVSLLLSASDLRVPAPSLSLSLPVASMSMISLSL